MKLPVTGRALLVLRQPMVCLIVFVSLNARACAAEVSDLANTYHFYVAGTS